MVIDAGRTVHFTAPSAGDAVWSVASAENAGSVATIDAQGTFRADSAGRYLVFAKQGGSTSAFRVTAKRGSTNVGQDTTITLPAAGTAGMRSVVLSDFHLEVAPKSVQVQPGARQTFAGIGVDGDGGRWTIRPEWSAAVGGVVDTAGAFTAPGSAGTYKVVLKRFGDDLADTATVTVGDGGGSTATTPGDFHIEVEPDSVALAPGRATRFAAVGVSENSRFSVRVNWRATSGSISADGDYTAPSTAGRYQVVATREGDTLADTSTVVVTSGGITTDPAPAPAPIAPAPSPAPAPAGAVALQLVRLASGSGTVLVSSGIPLAPGRLQPGAVGQVRVTVGGVEQPALVEALQGRWRDGSLRAVLVQFSYPLVSGSPVGAQLELGATRSTAAPAKVAVSWDEPQAVALPSQVSDLVGSQLVGPTVAVAGSPFPTYESQFVQFSDQHWNATGANWEQGNYYDRALNHYAYWVRSGQVKYWQRATALAVNYRRGYLEANGYGASPHWSQLEGLALHYWLTGDERSRTAVVQTATRLSDAYTVALMGQPNYSYNEGRIQQRVLMGCLLAGQLGDTSRDWGGRADGYVNGILAIQRADGSYSWSNWGGYQANYMVGLQNDALIKYYEQRSADPRVLSGVKRALDYMWSTQWVSGAQAFQYVSGQAPTGGTDPAADLNGLIGPAYGWVYARTGDATYKTRGDAVLQGGIAGAYLAGQKQYNQQYYSTFNYLGWRR